MSVEGLAVDAEGLERFLYATFPSSQETFKIPSVTLEALELTAQAKARHLRPGGTVSGPFLMMLADTAMYLILLSRIGLVADAVTTDLHMRFLRRPPAGELLARAKLLKLGARLAVGEVAIFAASDTDRPVAHATVTYAIPPA